MGKYLMLLVLAFAISMQYLYADGEQKLISNQISMENQYIMPFEGVLPGVACTKYNSASIFAIVDKNKELAAGEILDLYEINKSQTKDIKLVIPDKNWFNSFAVSDKYIIVCCQYNLYVYDKNDLSCKLLRSIPLSVFYGDCFIENDKAILTKECFSCENNGDRVAVFDINSGENVSAHQFENPIGFPFLYYQPKRTISYCNNQLLVSDITEYKIRIYNMNYEQIGEISRKPNDWKQSVGLNTELSLLKNFRDLQKNKKRINALESYNSAIQFADFIDVNTILVCWTSSTKDSAKNFYYDLWKMNNSKWELCMGDIANLEYDANKMFDPADFGNLENMYYVSNGKIINFDTFPFDLQSINTKNITRGQLNDMVQKYYEKNNLKTSVFIFEIKK